ncbi:MAG: thioredoxin domain-containing protein [Sandaracinus sp.]
MADRHSAIWVVLPLVLAACGGAAPSGATTTPSGAPHGLHASRAPWSVRFANESVLSLRDDGTLRLDGEALGTLEEDGRLTSDGEVVATLAEDGTITLGGRPLAPHVEGSRLVENDVAVMEIDASDALHLRAPDGRELGQFEVDGASDEARPTILYLTTVYLLELAQEEDDEAEADVEAGRAEDAPIADDEIDEDLWRMPIDDAPAMGPADALVTIVELTDFQCPYCSRGAATVDALLARFPDDVRVVVRQRPLPFHEHARPAAEAALEARAQLGDAAFFEMASLLFANQRHLDRGTLEALAAVVGLDLPRFRRALDEDAHEADIERDMALGDAMGAEGTPTFYVNGELIVGAQPLPSFVHAVERARARAQAALDAGAPRQRLYEVMLAHAQTGSGAGVDPIPPAPEVRYADLPVPEGAVIGGASADRARATVQAFVDLGSPHATRARAVIERLLADPVRPVRVVLRFGGRGAGAARAAGEALLAIASLAGGDAALRVALELMASPDALSMARVAEIAARVAHVSDAQLRAALEGHPMRERALADRRALEQAGLAASPVVFLAGRRVVWGIPSAETMSAAVDAAIAHPDEGRPAAPSDVAHAPSGAHAVAGGGAWVTEHGGDGEGATSSILARWAVWDASGMIFDRTTAPPLRLRLDGLPPALGASLAGIRRGEIRRVWIPGGRVVYVEAVDVQ